jgi:hypothetical protein
MPIFLSLIFLKRITDFVAKTVRSGMTNASLIRRRLDLDSELVGLDSGMEGVEGNQGEEKHPEQEQGLQHPARLQAELSGSTGKIDSQRIRPYEVEQGTLKCESRGVGVPNTGLYRDNLGGYDHDTNTFSSAGIRGGISKGMELSGGGYWSAGMGEREKGGSERGITWERHDRVFRDYDSRPSSSANVEHR